MDGSTERKVDEQVEGFSLESGTGAKLPLITACNETDKFDDFAKSHQCTPYGVPKSMTDDVSH